MTEVSEVVVIQADDWGVMYIDDESVYQDHKISVKSIAGALEGEAVKISYKYVEGKKIDDYLYEHGQFPVTLAECKKLINP